MYEGIRGVRERCGQAASHGPSRGRKVFVRRTKKWVKRKARCGSVIRSPSTSDAANGEHGLPLGDTAKGLNLAPANISVPILENRGPKRHWLTSNRLGYMGSGEKISSKLIVH